MAINNKNSQSNELSGTAERNKPVLIPVLKILVTVWIFMMLFSYIGFQETLKKINNLGVGSAIWILFILTLQQFVAAMRWHIILRRIGEAYGAGRVTQIFMAGAIANSVLINTLAGLSVRVLLLSRSGTKVKRALYGLVLALSMAIISLGFYSVGVIAMSLEVDISIIALMAIQPGIVIVSALPLSLGGWGVREASVVVGFGLLEVEAGDALAISLTYGLLGILATFIAAGASLLFRVRTGGRVQ